MIAAFNNNIINGYRKMYAHHAKQSSTEFLFNSFSFIYYLTNVEIDHYNQE